MAAYIIAEENVTDPEGFREYLKRVVPTIQHFGGKILAAGGISETLEGDWHPSRLVILEFASVDQARGWYTSEEFAPLKAIRLKTATTQGVLIQGI